MYAVVRVQGQQLRVEPDQIVQVPRLGVEIGTQLEIGEVLAIGAGDDDNVVRLGQPLVPGATVTAEVVRHGRGPKVLVMKFKRRKDYRRRQGHRADYTELRIQGVNTGAATAAATASAPESASAPAPASTPPVAGDDAPASAE